MNAQHSHHQDTGAKLAVYALAQGISALQTQLDSAPTQQQQALMACTLDGMNCHHLALQETLQQGLTMLLEVNHGLHCMVALLEHCDTQSLNSKDLACLLKPQQCKLLLAIEHSSQVL